MKDGVYSILFMRQFLFIYRVLLKRVGANFLLILYVGDSAVLKNEHDDVMFRKHSC